MIHFKKNPIKIRITVSAVKKTFKINKKIRYQASRGSMKNKRQVVYGLKKIWEPLL